MHIMQCNSCGEGVHEISLSIMRNANRKMLGMQKERKYLHMPFLRIYRTMR
ncbi:MAG: hypothetical protein PWR13_722 [Archaeoglobi archaeon]|nr:hypothetical protein [Archaeoglobi archaeon]MDK2781694.1 hypothetical protein [Archaeoglobi archaeon]